MCKIDVSIKSLLMMSIIASVLSPLNIFVLFYNINMIKDVDIIYSSTLGEFLYLNKTGYVTRNYCNQTLNCSNTLMNIVANEADGLVTYTANYNFTNLSINDIYHYTRTSLSLCIGFCFIGFVFNVITFFIIKSIQDKRTLI